MLYLKRAGGKLYYYKTESIHYVDEFHYIFTCVFFKKESKCYLPSFGQFKPNSKKLVSLGNVLNFAV